MLMPAKRLEYKPDPNKFDLCTHAWDAQGKLIRKNLYRAHIIEGRTYYERPVNSGNLWFENNQPAGRVNYEFGPSGKIAKKTFDFNAPHKDFVPELTGADKLAFELEQQRELNKKLQEQLAAAQAAGGKTDEKVDSKELAAVIEGFPAQQASGGTSTAGEIKPSTKPTKGRK